jgi:hypothetical protein
MPELVVKEQGPTKANAVEHFGQDVHAHDANPADGQTQYLDDRALPSEGTFYYFMPRRADAACGHPSGKTPDERTVTMP